LDEVASQEFKYGNRKPVEEDEVVEDESEQT
jgi:hypothetical protein